MKIERMTASKQTPARVNGIRIAIQSDEFQSEGHLGRNDLSNILRHYFGVRDINAAMHVL